MFIGVLAVVPFSIGMTPTILKIVIGKDPSNRRNKMKVRVHAINKKTDMGKRMYPQCISQAFNTDNTQDKVLADEKVKEYKALGGKSTEMLVEIIEVGGTPSWEE
jgi:hypothetical protein